MRSFANDFKGQKFRIESVIADNPVQGVATIRANYSTIAWGEAQFGNILYFHTFFLKIENGKVVEITINPRERFEDERGGVKYIGTEAEVKKLYEVLIGNLCENDAIATRKQETLKAIVSRLNSLAARNAEIREMRLELKTELDKLCSDKNLTQQLANPEILKLSGVLSTLNILHPERNKK